MYIAYCITELDELSDYIRTAMEKMRDIVWAMDSRKDKYENLIDKMVYFANSHLKDSQFSCQFEIKEIVQDANMKPDIRQNIYLMFKEAITNIRKHSNGDEVKVNLRKVKGKLIFSVKDNGSNLDIAKSEGLGLSNMKMRAEQMGAEFFINKVNGFEIGLILPNA